MSIITLTSDFGHTSHYAAVLKGIIFSLHPAAQIVDVTHNIPSFDIMEAAYVVRHTYPAFPAGTIHLISVDPSRGESKTGIVMNLGGQYFVGANNGLMSLIGEGVHHECVEIENEGLIQSKYPNSFRAARIFAPTAAFLASGGTLAEVGSPIQMKDLMWGHPIYAGNCLRGKIIHIDSFGNVITNIHKTEFMRLKLGRPFEIFIRSVRLKRIVNTYSDVGKGEPLAIFGETGHLEISMRETSAASMLGLKIHDMITIEFK